MLNLFDNWSNGHSETDHIMDWLTSAEWNRNDFKSTIKIFWWLMRLSFMLHFLPMNAVRNSSSNCRCILKLKRFTETEKFAILYRLNLNKHSIPLDNPVRRIRCY
jgi:hypothetical protein